MMEITEKGLRKGYTIDLMAELTLLPTEEIEKIKKEIDKDDVEYVIEHYYHK